jgi:hypothetical protein
MVCVVWSDSSSEEESMTSAWNLSSIFYMYICVGSNCGSMAAHNSAQKMSKKPTGTIVRTGRGRRNRQMFGPQSGDTCAPEPTPTEILFSGAVRTE